MLTDDLLAYLFDGGSHDLAQPMATWLASSRRFSAFVGASRDKIRKKIRTRQDRESLLDLQLELETAYLLLRERSFSVAYEPEQSKGIRSPDFAVTFTTSLTFMLEVTRVQERTKNGVGEFQAGSPAPMPSVPRTAGAGQVSPAAARLVDAVEAKLGQLLPQRSNILLVGFEAINLTQSDVRDALLGMQRRAERNDLAFLEGYRFRDRADFFNHFQRLSEILVRGLPFEAAKPLVTWINSQAKYPMPSRVRTSLYRSLTV